PPLYYEYKSSDIGIPLSVLDMISSTPIESKQTISSHVPNLIPLPTLSITALQQAELSWIQAKPKSILYLEETSEEIEINSNLDTVSATLIIKSD
ncbi:32255_t:CDS:2, partial [Gigaspora margarita]